ncbi:hypothetical protein BJ973_004080 [Actinoplanes tereljensis]|uniref:TIR domain-containing protein n=1 Tax=Paractinoplanes tereljensis TaxID=571912 RepID=UPI0019410819|nr:TIR domain-containing protein [Actinoplanes tereljensis]
MGDIFVNYRSDDEPGVAVLLDEKLCERFGRDRVFRDNRSIGLGVDFRPQLWGRLAKSSVLMVVCGARWLAADEHGRRRVDDPDDFVRREIEWALTMGIAVVPVLVGDVPDLKVSDLPSGIADLAHRQRWRLRTRGMQRDIPQLIDEIASIVSDTSVPGTVMVLQPAGHEADLSGLSEAVTLAASDAGLPAVEIIRRVFGLIAEFPSTVEPIRVVSGFLSSMEHALSTRSAPDGAPLRVLVGVQSATTRGVDPRDQLTRLLAQPAVTAVRRRATGAGLVLVIPNDFYDAHVRTHPELADPATYLPVPSDDGMPRSWVHVPGYSSPPGLRLASKPTPTPPTGAGVHFNNYDSIIENQIAGDYVRGDKHSPSREQGHQ